MLNEMINGDHKMKRKLAAITDVLHLIAIVRVSHLFLQTIHLMTRLLLNTH